MRPNLLAATAALALVFLGSTARAERILYLGDGDSAVASAVYSTLTSSGNQVTIGPSVTSFGGAGLAGYNAVVMAPGLLPPVWNNGPAVGADMPMSGQQALINFVAAGGGLVTGGDTLLDLAQGGFKSLSPLMPFIDYSAASTGNSPITFGVQTANSIIDAHLPQNFTFNSPDYQGTTPTEEYYLPKTNATSFFTTSQWSPTFGLMTPSSGALGWTYGLGQVLSISSPINTSTMGNLNFAQLVSNSVNWTTRNQTVPPASGANPPTSGANPPIDPAPIPEPSNMLIWGLALAGALVSRRIK